MALQQRKAGASNNGESTEGGLPAPDKIARLLALIVTRDMSTDDAAMKLLGVGFTAREISSLLGVGTNYVHVVKNRRKTSSGKKVQKKLSNAED